LQVQQQRCAITRTNESPVRKKEVPSPVKIKINVITKSELEKDNKMKRVKTDPKAGKAKTTAK
jgi:hypothetical protein